MAADYKLIKAFNAFRGIDLRSSDIVRPAEFASDLLNVDYRDTGAMDKRKGYQARIQENGGAGLSVYSDIDINTGQVTEKLVCVDSTLSVMLEEELSITYSGSATAYTDLYLDDDDLTFYLDLYEDNTRVLHFPIGVGVDEPSPVLVDDVVTAINGVTNFSASAGANANIVPAAFLEVTRNLTLTATPATIQYMLWEDATLPTNAPTPFTNAQANKLNADFENATFANINGVLYISTGYDELYKFDGTRLYRAGLPAAPSPSLALNGGGTEVPGTPTYIIEYEYIDAKGNLITSIESDPVSITAGGSRVDLTIDNILDTSGFDTDSANLVINIYRNKSGGLSYFLVDSIANSPTSPTQLYTDSKDDSQLGIEFIQPIKQHGLPPKLKYISVYQGLLVGTGNRESVNTVYYSDIDSPEYFPAGDNAFEIETLNGDINTGIAPLGNSLFVFKKRSTHQILGNLADDTFAVNFFGNGRIGCEAHHSIQEVNGYLMFLADNGIYALNQNEQSITEVSERISPLLEPVNTKFTFKKAVAINWLDQDKYVLFMPVENNDAASSESIVFVYDYSREAWLKWDNINMMGGTALYKNRLFKTERRRGGLLREYTYRFHDSGDTWDYADHTAPITFSYKSHWEHLGEPSVFKKFIRCKIHSLDASLDDFESDSFKLLLETEKDWVTAVSTSRELDFGGDQSGWGLDPWGSFSWGNERSNSERTKLRQTKAKALRLILTNSEVNKNVLISGYEYEVAAPYRGFIKE